VSSFFSFSFCEKLDTSRISSCNKKTPLSAPRYTFNSQVLLGRPLLYPPQYTIACTDTIIIILRHKQTSMLSVSDIVSSEKVKFNTTNKDVMHLCRVVKTIAKTTSYELFDLKSGAFLLSCVADNDMKGDFLFTTLRGGHDRELKAIPMSNYSSSFLGILKRNLLGLSFALYNDHSRLISRIG
jgi:hypothetical protein